MTDKESEKYIPTLDYQIKILKAIKKNKRVEYITNHWEEWEVWNNKNHFPNFTHHYFRVVEQENNEKIIHKKFEKVCKAIRKYLLSCNWTEIPLFSHEHDEVNSWVCGHMVDLFTGLAHSIDCGFVIESNRELVIKLNEKK